MTAPAVVEVIVPDVPKRVRNALIRDARKRQLSVNEVAARILTTLYGVDRDPIQTRFVPVTSEDRLTFRVPAELRSKLRVAAAENDATIRGLVIAALAVHYEIPFNGTARRPRSK